MPDFIRNIHKLATAYIKKAPPLVPPNERPKCVRFESKSDAVSSQEITHVYESSEQQLRDIFSNFLIDETLAVPVQVNFHLTIWIFASFSMFLLLENTTSTIFVGIMLGMVLTIITFAITLFLWSMRVQPILAYQRDLKQYILKQIDLRKPDQRNINDDLLTTAIHKCKMGWVYASKNLKYDRKSILFSTEMFAKAENGNLYLYECDLKNQSHLQVSKNNQMGSHSNLASASSGNPLQVSGNAIPNSEIKEEYFHLKHHIDLTSATLNLYPSDIMRMRLWNHRFPLVIEYPTNDAQTTTGTFLMSEIIKTDRVDADESASITGGMARLNKNPAKINDVPEFKLKASSYAQKSVDGLERPDSQKTRSMISNTGLLSKSGYIVPQYRDVIYIFTPTDVEKERWFTFLSAHVRTTLTPFYRPCPNSQEVNVFSQHMRMIFDRNRHFVESFNSNASRTQTSTNNQTNAQTNSVFSASSPSTAGLEHFSSSTLNAMGSESENTSWRSPQTPINQGSTSNTPLASSAGNQDQSNAPQPNIPSVPSGSMFSVNVLVARIFWNIWRDPLWTSSLMKKIQLRLSSLKPPPYIKNLTVKHMSLGDSVPMICYGDVPILDKNRGIWVYLPIRYEGKFEFSIDAQVNCSFYDDLVKKLETSDGFNSGSNKVAQNTDGTDSHDEATGEQPNLQEMHEFFNSITRSIPGGDSILGSNFSSSTDISQPNAENQGSRDDTDVFLETHTGKVIANYIGKIQNSSFVKKVAESEFVKRQIKSLRQKLENATITLSISVTSLKGTLTLHIPPPPSDRIWYGFREMPATMISAVPKIKKTQFDFTRLSTWIVQKIREELKDIFVLPSMESIYVPLLSTQLPEEDENFHASPSSEQAMSPPSSSSLMDSNSSSKMTVSGQEKEQSYESCSNLSDQGDDQKSDLSSENVKKPHPFDRSLMSPPNEQIQTDSSIHSSEELDQPPSTRRVPLPRGLGFPKFNSK